jgi:hypothetical protein
MALADQRHQEIRHAHTSSSYRPGFNFASMATGVIKGIDLGARSPSLPAVIRALAGKLRVSCGAAGARVIVPARDPDRAAAALAGLDVLSSNRWICSIRWRSTPSPNDS